MFFNYICENHFDIMSDGWDEKLFARVLGRDMSTILKKYIVLKNKIQEILNTGIIQNEESKIAQYMVGSAGTLQEKIEVLKSLRQGIWDNING
ncbi:MAG: hypothetical protein HGGPFJEG_00987 [Ignavibacteria bacterium]|nr:hypothetical protein [Ignavibacteria bacterium]